LDNDNDEILVDNGLTLGHLSLDEIEGVYFLKFSMLKILKMSKDFITIMFPGSAWQSSDNAKRISSTDAWVTISGRITYNEPINFRDESVTTMISEKINSQINIRGNSGQLMKLSSRGLGTEGYPQTAYHACLKYRENHLSLKPPMATSLRCMQLILKQSSF
jgi:hypothetical protein